MGRQKTVDETFPQSKAKHTIAKPLAAVRDTFRDLTSRSKRTRQLRSPSREAPEKKRKAFVDLTNHSNVLVTVKKPSEQNDLNRSKQQASSPDQNNIARRYPCKLSHNACVTRSRTSSSKESQPFPEDVTCRRMSETSKQLVAGLEPLKLEESIVKDEDTVPMIKDKEPLDSDKENVDPAKAMHMDAKLNITIESRNSVQTIAEPSPASVTASYDDIDAGDYANPLLSSEYVMDIFHYMRQKEDVEVVLPYLERQHDITAHMRAILVDWLVEVQENFELVHETLYLAVKFVDRYLDSLCSPISRESLQLLGATALMVAAKFEEPAPPTVDDFLYICDDAYSRADMIAMEEKVLHNLDYKLDSPVAYRFLRRFAKAARIEMETHTLARYITELSLQEYEFVSQKSSLIAASALYMAIRMQKLGTWTQTLEHYTRYSIDDIRPCVRQLNEMLKQTNPNLTSVRCKYAHEVFFKVALRPPLDSSDEIFS